jgi:DNA topoisomerase IB
MIDTRFLFRCEQGLEPKRQDMTTQEIQQYIDAAIGSHFDDLRSESGEMMTSKGGDGRFLGKVFATRYGGLPSGRDIFLAIGETEKKLQIVKLGKTECVKPSEDELDALLIKELGIKKKG